MRDIYFRVDVSNYNVITTLTFIREQVGTAVDFSSQTTGNVRRVLAVTLETGSSAQEAKRVNNPGRFRSQEGNSSLVRARRTAVLCSGVAISTPYVCPYPMEDL
jgi:hypothetical protein